jgi:hypothetical protein
MQNSVGKTLVGTSHKAPGVKSMTGYLATEQSDVTMEDWSPGYRTAQTNNRKRFYLVGLEPTL